MSSEKPSRPYYCPQCLREEGCGYHGTLRIHGATIPTCDHHSETGQTIKMVPVSERRRG